MDLKFEPGRGHGSLGLPESVRSQEALGPSPGAPESKDRFQSERRVFLNGRLASAWKLQYFLVCVCVCACRMFFEWTPGVPSEVSICQGGSGKGAWLPPRDLYISGCVWGVGVVFGRARGDHPGTLIFQGGCAGRLLDERLAPPQKLPHFQGCAQGGFWMGARYVLVSKGSSHFNEASHDTDDFIDFVMNMQLYVVFCQRSLKILRVCCCSPMVSHVSCNSARFC